MTVAEYVLDGEVSTFDEVEFTGGEVESSSLWVIGSMVG